GAPSAISANWNFSASGKALQVVRVVWFTSSLMKSRLGALAALLLGTALTLAPAEDIKTVTGEEYKNVKISRVEPDGLVIVASYGIIKIPFTELSPELQQKYRYDAKAGDTYRKQVDDAKTLREQSIAAAQQKRAQELAAAAAAAAAAVPPSAVTTARPGPIPDAQTNTTLNEPSRHGTMLDQRPGTGMQHTGTERFSTSSAAGGEPWAIKGKVLSAADEGVIVYCIKDQSFGR